MGKIWGNIGEIMINICTIEKKAMTLQIRHKTNKQQIKYPLSRLLPIISILCKIECYFMSHIRKYICIVGITIFFLISSSFSFDIENDITFPSLISISISVINPILFPFKRKISYQNSFNNYG